ncbi:MAG: Heat shock protein HslJ [Candidatus Erwinia impunctatus]|nr:Heat shock protein HslJ [Culicoides impunctatus]
MSLRMSVLAAAVVLAGCTTTPTQVGGTSSLAGRHFELSQADGQRVSEPARVPEIAFDDTLRVSGAVCNRFFGQGKISEGKLLVPQLASTKMLCSSEQLNQWENTLSNLLMEGAVVTLDKQTLTLSGNGHTFIYVEVQKKS